MSETTTTAAIRRKPGDLLGPGNYKQIARDAGLTYQHVSRVLRGMKTCSVDVAVLIAQSAGVTLDQLWAFIESNRVSRLRAEKIERRRAEKI